MGDTSSDPDDHARPTRKYAGEASRNGRNGSGVILLAVAAVAMVVALAAFATGNATAGVAATGLSAVAFFAGGGWLYVARRQVREQEARSLAQRPDADAQPPASRRS